MTWLDAILAILHRKPAPPRPTPTPPVPVPVPPTPPPTRPGDPEARAIAELNRIRAGKGLGPLIRDDRLTHAAQSHAGELAAGRARPHDQLEGRVYTLGGFPRQACGTRSGFPNISEGITEGARTPEEVAGILAGSPDPHEGHRRDVEDPVFNRVGVGFAGGWAVVDYGAVCRPEG